MQLRHLHSNDLRAELDDIVSVHCRSHASIDNALRAYLSFGTNYKGGGCPKWVEERWTGWERGLRRGG